MKKISLSAVALLLSALFMFSAFTPVARAEEAAPRAFDSSFIKQVIMTVKDSQGTNTVALDKDSGSMTPLKIQEDATVKLDYKFEIPDDVEGESPHIVPNQPYTVQLPNVFNIVGSLSGTLNQFGTYTIDTAGLVTLIFNDNINKDEFASGRGATFHVETKFKKSEDGNSNPTAIDFTIGGETVTIPIQIIKPVAKPTIQKSDGTYHKDTGNITWNITVNPGNTEDNKGLTAAVVTDTLDGNQDFVDASAYVTTAANGVKGSGPITPDVNGKTLVFELGDIPAGTTKTITYQTTPTSAVYKQTGNTATVNNKAELTSEQGVDPANAKASIPIDWINKRGTYNADTKQIDWTIVVNKQNQTIPAGATITDTLPKYLALDDTTGKVQANTNTINTGDHTADIYYTVADQTVKFYFNKEITEANTITFSTNIDPAYYNANNSGFKNTATLQPKDSGDTGGGRSSTSDSVGPGSSVIEKKPVGSYNAKTHEITWQITVNKNKMAITNPVVTDTIDAHQAFVSVSGSQKETSLTDTATKPFYTLDGRQVTINLQDFAKDDDPVVLTLVTKVTDPDYYAANGQNQSVTQKVDNSVNLKGTTQSGNIDQSDKAYQDVTSQMLAKAGKGYDYASKQIPWEITVNQNNMHMTNTTVTDTIPDGLTFVDAVTIGGTVIPKDQPVSGSDFYYTYSSRLLTVHLGTIDTQQTITFKTTVDNDIFEKSEENISFTNKATLKIDYANPVTVTATQTVKHSIVEKTHKYTNGNTYIDWQVLINKNQIPLGDFLNAGKKITITDNLQEGLALDTTSVFLYPVQTNDGGITFTHIGAPVELPPQSIQYKPDSREFTFTFPDGLDLGKAYQLEFATDITQDMTKSSQTFSNSVTFAGTVNGQTSSPDAVMIAQQTSSGGAWGTPLGKFTVIKEDKSNSQIKLAGAGFALYNGTTLVRSGFTDANGELTFKRLALNVPYKLIETKAPDGYDRSSEEYFFTPKNGDEIRYHYTNTKTTDNGSSSESSSSVPSSSESSSSTPSSSTSSSSSGGGHGGHGGGGGGTNSSEVSSVASSTSSIVSSTSSNPNENIGDDGIGKAGASSKPASGNPNENIGDDGVGKAGGSPKTGESNTYLPIIISLMLAAAIVLILAANRSRRSKKAQ